MQAISADHEFLTKEGWKRNITTADELATFSNTLTPTLGFVQPTQVTTTPYSGDLIFVETPRINIFGTPGLMVYSPEPTTLLDCVHRQQTTFTVVHPTLNPHLAGISKKCNEYEAEATMMLALTNGCHASIAKIPNSLDQDVYCNTYANNVIVNQDSPDTCIIHLGNNKGTSVMNITLPSQLPICVRRAGKCCWVWSGAKAEWSQG